MKFLGGLSELYGTAQAGAKMLDNLNSISGHVAGIMNRRMQRMGAMGDFTTGAPWLDQSGGTVNDPNVIDFGQASTVTIQEHNSLGGTNTFYSDGSVVITNAAGQDVTSNYTNSTSSSNNVTSSVTNPANGTTTTKYSNGSVVITNAQGQDVTENFTHPGMGIQSGASMFADSLGDAVKNLPTLFSDAAGKATDKLTGILKPIAVIGVVGLIAYFVFVKGKK